jgi:hypothetical protein
VPAGSAGPLSRRVPNGKSRSSCTTSSPSAAGIPRARSRAATGGPDWLIVHSGLARSTSRPASSIAATRQRGPAIRNRAPARSARCSTTEKPALWRVPANHGPGLPRPAMSQRLFGVTGEL